MGSEVDEMDHVTWIVLDLPVVYCAAAQFLLTWRLYRSVLQFMRLSRLLYSLVELNDRPARPRRMTQRRSARRRDAQRKRSRLTAWLGLMHLDEAVCLVFRDCR